jgi:hypothetical protein
MRRAAASRGRGDCRRSRVGGDCVLPAARRRIWTADYGRQAGDLASATSLCGPDPSASITHALNRPLASQRVNAIRALSAEKAGCMPACSHWPVPPRVATVYTPPSDPL